MALLATQSLGVVGLQPAYTSASATDTFVPTDRTFLFIKNTNAATRTVTVTTPPTTGGLGIADMVSGTIAATTGEWVLGPFPANLYAVPTTGLATITPSATAGVSYGAFNLQVTQ